MAKLSQVGTGLRQNAEIDDTVSPFMQKVCTGGVCTPDPNQMYGYSKYGGSMVPYGNPVYEGTGYPAAGFGERRRKVVPLKGKQFKFNPQTQEYEPTQRFTTDKVNVRSDFYSPVVASFGGLSEYPAITYPQGKATLYGVRGLGQAKQPAAVRKLLRDSKGNFSNEKFEALKKILIDAYQQAEKDYKRTLDAATVLNPMASLTVKQAAARIKQSLRENTRPRLDLFGKQLREEWFNANNAVWDEPSNNYQNFLNQIRNEINLFQKDAQVLDFAADMSFYNALLKRADEIRKKVPDPGDILKVIPWVVGGIALVAFFPLIRKLGK